MSPEGATSGGTFPSAAVKRPGVGRGSSARTAERRCQQLNALETLRPELLAYLNRISDLLFVAARLIGKRQGISEILWQEAAKPS